MKKAAKTIKNHLWRITNAIVLKVSNRLAENINSYIKIAKVRARGFRNNHALPMQSTSVLEDWIYTLKTSKTSCPLTKAKSQISKLTDIQHIIAEVTSRDRP